MSDQVEVANLALQRVGAGSIISLDDATPEARVVKIRFGQSRRVIIRSHPWNFATDRITLAALVSTPVFGYAYQHQQPTDCVRVLEVNDYPVPGNRYRIEGRLILADESPLELKYLRDVVDFTKWDVDAIEALVAHLAWKIAYRLTQSSTLIEQLALEYRLIASKARFDDAAEEPAEVLEAEDWLDSRVGYNRGFIRDPMT